MTPLWANRIILISVACFSVLFSSGEKKSDLNLLANEGSSFGFEKAKAGPFEQLKTSIGIWKSEAGRVLIDGKHAKTGKQCLQLAGGKESTATLVLAEEVETASELTFWAERWTSRSPFSFRIAVDRGKGFQEIYDGSKTIRVGRAFLNHVKVGLPVGVKRLQFNCSSPPGTGILIDDLRIAPKQPQEVISVEILPLTLPALVGKEASALLKLKIETRGQLNPISLTEFHAMLAGDANQSDILSFQLHHGGGQNRFLASKPVASLGAKQAKGEPLVLTCLPAACPLVEGDNYLWISCRLSKEANVDHLLGVAGRSISFSDGKTIKLNQDPSIQRMGVALRNGGDDGVHTYRIPGLATTNKGTLVGVYDVRRRSGGDLPGDIDVGMSRSTDGGRAWEPMKVIMDMGNDPRWRYDGIGDPAILVDQTTGTIWVAATWSHGNRSWLGSGPGLKPEETGQLMLVRSDDDGVSWSEPINITEQVKKPEWCFILQGPGKGITMRDGTIVFAAQYQDTPQKKRLPRSTIIYSKDHGMTWKVGAGAFDDTTEAQVVETKPGTLMLNCRYNRKAVRVVMTTDDMGETWKKHSSTERSLIEPRACMASLIDPGMETGEDWGEWLLFSNPDSVRGRHHITIKASPDRGLTWPKEHRLLLDEETSAGYSCMSMIDEKTIGILYEGSQAHMTFQRIPLSDLMATIREEASTGSDRMDNALKPLDVFVLTGQSNSLGTIDPADGADPLPPISGLDATIPFFWSNRSTRSGDGSAVLIGDSGGGFVPLRAQQGEGKNPVFWGPEVGFARTIRSAGHRDFAIIKASRGGGGNSFWLKGSRDDHMYRHIVRTVSDAVRVLPRGRSFRIRAVLYVQGESDNETEAVASGERLETLLANLHRDLPGASGARLIVGGIASAGTRPNVVRREQAAAAERNPSIEYIDNLDLQGQLYDRLHFDRQAKLEVGQRIAQRWLDLDLGSTPVSQLSLPRVFGDHMVLQAAASLPIWGKARPSSVVSVQLGEDTLTARSGIHGDWVVRFDPRPASAAPISLSVQSGDEQLKRTDILIGEVWVCAGQSNMEWMLAQSVNAREELASSANPNLRLLHLAGGARGSLGTYTQQHLARLTPGEFCKGQWETASSTSAGSFSAVAWHFGRLLQRELKVPVGLICPAIGGTPAEAWVPREMLEADPRFKGMVAGNWLDNKRLGAFCRMRGQQNLLAAIQSGLTIPGDSFGPNHSFKPGFMWEAGIEPLIPYAIRGAIWYQGESNAETKFRVREHGKLFPLLIKQWRQQWGQGDFPFLFVQLPALNRSEWPLFREGQRRILDQLENIGMAITIDTGHPTDVHPREKKPVGERLAKWVLGTSYALKKHATYSGPLLDVAEREGDSLVVSFKQVGGGLETSDKKAPRHFEVCGKDGVFHPAGAKIIGKNTLSVASPKVSAPQYVRYAWMPYPVPSVNLINSEDLPASPFSSESEEAIFALRDEPIEKNNKDTRPNILLIVGEDHGCELSCYGDPVINTPNIDALASDGVLFENGYVTQSVCSPSRSTIFTGLYPHQNGQLGLATHNYGWFKRWPTTYSLLKKAGYRTGLIGKTHVIPAEAVEDFVNFRFQKSSNFAKRKVTEYASKAGEFFRDGEDPFFMTVNYPDAHWPLQGQVDSLPGTQVDPKRVKVMPYVGGAPPRLLEVARNYYDCMLRLDACVGQLLKQLDDSGKADNTLVVFIGDHGAQMARGKVTVYEGGMRVPYIVRWPGSTKPNHRSKALVSTIDLLPTFMDAAGSPTPRGLPGQSLRPVLGGTTDDIEFRKYLACERNCDAARHTFPQRTIRDDRYKLIHSPVRDREDPAARYYQTHGAAHWSGCLTDKELAGASKQTKTGYARWLKPPEYQLYDLKVDPYEWIDLSNDTKHAEAKRRLQTALKEWQADTRDPISDREKLSMLMKENEAVFKAGRRWPKEGWQYLKYMAPSIDGQTP
jgi:sialidase-1